MMVGSVNRALEGSLQLRAATLFCGVSITNDDAASVGECLSERFRETNRIGWAELKPTGLILRRLHSSRLEGWPRARSRLGPSFETVATLPPQDEVNRYDSNHGNGRLVWRI